MTTVLEFTLAVAESSPDAAAVQTAVGLIEAIVTDNIVVELSGFGPYGEWDQVRVLIRGYLPPTRPMPPGCKNSLRRSLQAPAAELYGELHVQELSAESWADAWKQHYHPLRVGQTLLISPSWEEPEIRAGGPRDLVGPGHGFRHGRASLDHADFGTAGAPFAAGKQHAGRGHWLRHSCHRRLQAGRGHGFATDIDVQAVEVARENSQLNQVGERITVEAASVPETGEYDLICANILADVIADLLLHEGLADRLTPDGVLLLSGIITPRSHVVELALAARDLKVIDSLQSGDWLALAAARR